MVVFQVCAYAADYPGNFLMSLLELDKALKREGHKTIYAFPVNARDKEWCRELQKSSKVFFLPLSKARLKIQTYAKLHSIIKKEKVDIIHSHFELYDVPATVVSGKKQRVFWHLHDPIIKTTWLRNIADIFQYKYVGQQVQLLSVAEYYKQFAIELGFPAENAVTILNGIDLNRIDLNCEKEEEFDFLTFGWDFMRKGSDVILNVCKRLEKEGYKFKFCLNGGPSTWKILNDYLKGESFEWLVCSNPEKDINQLFKKARCFIQASRRETFSYAIAEAAYFGLPVLSSDIEGVRWAKDLPTVQFFESENEEELYLLMKEILETKQTYTDVQVEKTREIIENNYSVKCWVNNIRKMYGI